MEAQNKSFAQKKDEFKVQTYLFQAEVRRQMGNLEKDWRIAQRAMKETGTVFTNVVRNMSRDAAPLIQEIRGFYGRVRNKIKEQNPPNGV